MLVSWTANNLQLSPEERKALTNKVYQLPKEYRDGLITTFQFANMVTKKVPDINKTQQPDNGWLTELQLVYMQEILLLKSWNKKNISFYMMYSSYMYQSPIQYD